MRARLHPLGNGRYSVLFDGKLLVDRSRDPECDAARALLARGYMGTLLMLDGKAGKHRTTIDIERAAKPTVEEGPYGPRFVKRRTVVDRAPSPETDRDSHLVQEENAAAWDH